MSDWDYGNAYLRHPCEGRTVRFDDGSLLRCHDIFQPIPEFMHGCDLIFTDSPWNRGNLRTFYTKADMPYPDADFPDFMHRLFACVSEIGPDTCYLEIGKEYLGDYITEMKKLYPKVTFYNSTYYHKQSNKCYIVRGGRRRPMIALDDVDEENAISEIIAAEGSVIGDLCMGRGLVACAARSSGKQFRGTELNHKRLSVAVERLFNTGLKYTLEE